MTSALGLSWHTGRSQDDGRCDAHRADLGGTGSTANANTLPRRAQCRVGHEIPRHPGYPGANDALLAMERGETQGFCSLGFATIAAIRPGWVRDRKVNIFVQLALRKSSEHPEVPSALDLAKDAGRSQAIDWIRFAQTLCPPFAAPPACRARLEALRKAFDETMTDPDYLAEAARGALHVELVTGAELAMYCSESTRPRRRSCAREGSGELAAPRRRGRPRLRTAIDERNLCAASLESSDDRVLDQAIASSKRTIRQLRTLLKISSSSANHVERDRSSTVFCWRNGRFEEGGTPHRQAISLVCVQRDLLQSRNYLKYLQRPLEALDAFNKALAITRRIPKRGYRGTVFQRFGALRGSNRTTSNRAVSLRADFAGKRFQQSEVPSSFGAP